MFYYRYFQDLQNGVVSPKFWKNIKFRGMAKEVIDAVTCHVWVLYQNSDKMRVCLPSQKKFDETGRKIVHKCWMKVECLDMKTCDPEDLHIDDEMLFPDESCKNDTQQFLSQDFGYTVVENTIMGMIEKAMLQLETTESDKLYHDSYNTNYWLCKYQFCLGPCLVLYLGRVNVW